MKRFAVILSCWAVVVALRADEPAASVIADYEDDLFVARITEVSGARLTDCRLALAAIPARQQNSLQVDITATRGGAIADVGLRFRIARRFDTIRAIATQAWIDEGAASVGLRVRDSAGRVFESGLRPVAPTRRWVRLAFAVGDGSDWSLVGGSAGEGEAEAGPVWPLEVIGYRVRSERSGRQTVYLDDLEVLHAVPVEGQVGGFLWFDQPTHLYAPGQPVRAAVLLENRSRQRSLSLSVELAWLRLDGSEVATGRQRINLPASSADFRSQQSVDFSRVLHEPGLYRLVARVRGAGWLRPAIFRATIAVTPSNRALPRGRSIFFALQANLLRESPGDQALELQTARELGVQLLCVETPWSLIEPRRDEIALSPLTAIVRVLSENSIGAFVVLTDPPAWAAALPADAFRAQQEELAVALANRYGARLSGIQLLWPTDSRNPTAADIAALEQIGAAVRAEHEEVVVATPPLELAARGMPWAGLLDALRDSKLSATFATAGPLRATRVALAEFAERRSWTWRSTDRWVHQLPPLTSLGTLSDAVEVLEHYVFAARAGVQSLVLNDLRDDGADPRRAEVQFGLLRRDFSPKATVLGFANTVGLLYGMRAADVPLEADSGVEATLFVSADRQVVVLVPQGDGVGPALVRPIARAPGTLYVYDFERRSLPLVGPDVAPLAVAPDQPMFLELELSQATTEPSLSLGAAWVSAPRVVRVVDTAEFVVTVAPPEEVGAVKVDLRFPENAALGSDFSARRIAATGEATELTVRVRKLRDFGEPVVAELEIEAGGTEFAVPVRFDPLVRVSRGGGAGFPRASDRVAVLRAPENEDIPIEARLHARYESGVLRFAVDLPPGVPATAQLHFGLATGAMRAPAEFIVEEIGGKPRVSRTIGIDGAALTAEVVAHDAAGTTSCVVSIPPAALGARRWEAGGVLKLAVRYVEPATALINEPFVLEWGSGLGVTRSADGYRTLELAR